MESNRWWEFYFVRYFVGSVLGSLVILALVFHPNSLLSPVIGSLFHFNSKDFFDLKSEHFLVVLGFSIAFCYISSAPILVLHAFRAHIDFKAKTKTSLRSWSFRAALLIPPLLIDFFIYKDNPLKFAFFFCYTLVIYFQATLVISAICNKFDTVFNFYKSLAKERAKDAQERKQYIESYRHLREHGNAFLILFCEVVLGCSLFVSDSLSEALLVIVIWLIPAIFVWVLGTALESNIENV